MSINLEKYKDLVRAAVYGSYSSRIRNKDIVPKEAETAFESKLFLFDKEYDEYSFIHHQIRRSISLSLRDMLLEMAKEQSVNAVISFATSSGKYYFDDIFVDYKNAPLFSIVIIDEAGPKLFMFKEYGLSNTIESHTVDRLLLPFGIKEWFFVSLVETGAYSEVLNHNNDIEDETRGTRIYSLKQFVDKYLGDESYLLVKEYSDYCEDFVDKHLGLMVLKSLVPGSIYTFKNDLKKVLRDYQFQDTVGVLLCEEDFSFLHKNYYESGNYRATTSDISLQKDGFGQSLITAEWLYQKRDYLGNIDLTVVALGYYKAIEELLFKFVLSCGNGHRFISIKVGDDNIKLSITEENFDEYKNRIMLGEMERFLRQCPEIFYSTAIKDAVLDEIKAIKKLRNGFLHKENLNDSKVVLESRKHVFNIIFLLEGSIQKSELSNRLFGFDEQSDFELLCRFLHDHQHMSYYIEEGERQFFALMDSNNCHFDYSETGNISIEQIYFNEFTGFPVDTEILDKNDMKRAKESFKQHCYTELNLPKKIMIGEFRACSEGFYIGGPQKEIWNNGFIE